jgi:hypothetical protein
MILDNAEYAPSYKESHRITRPNKYELVACFDVWLLYHAHSTRDE